MLKTISSSFALTTLCLFALTSCSSHNEFLKASSNELVIADDCRNTNKHLEMDCYDLISYKNSFAQFHCIFRCCRSKRRKMQASFIYP